MKLQIFVFIFTVSMLFNLPVGASVYCGKIKSVKGVANILRIKDGERGKAEPTRIGIKAQKKMKIFCDDILSTETASRMKIKLKSALLTIGPRTRLFVEDYNKSNGDASVIKMNYGKVRSFFKKTKESKKESRFKVKTPTTVSGVRGTDFFVSYEPNSAVSTQATITGEIEVKHIASQKSVVVESGQQAVVEPSASDKIKTGVSEGVEPQKASTLPTSDTEAKIKLEGITSPTVEKIRDASVLAKNEKVFTTKEAKKILGEPSSWEADEKNIPDRFKDIENEF